MKFDFDDLFNYHSVTTSCEYVWLGTDLARAKPMQTELLKISPLLSLKTSSSIKTNGKLVHYAIICIT